MLLVATVAPRPGLPARRLGGGPAAGPAGPAEGSVVTAPDGTPAGSSLIGIDPVPADPAADPYFHTRPSASAQDVLGPGDPSTSGGSNQGGFSDKLLDQINQRRAAIAAREGVAPERRAGRRGDRVGLRARPGHQPRLRGLQVARVARVTGLPEDAGPRARRGGHRRAGAGLPRRADGERHRAEPRRRRGADQRRPRADDGCHGDARRAADLPRRGAGVGKTFAMLGEAHRRAEPRHRRRRRAGRDPRPGQDRRAARGPGGRAPPDGRPTAASS